MYRLRKPGDAALADLLRSQSGTELSYQTVGSTVDGSEAPPGLRTLRVERHIGSGAERFAAAKAAIVDWAGHRRAGATLYPARPPLEVGSEVAVALKVWPLWITATCRVVRVIDEPDRFGFAYGTLRHHPALGEEVFLVIRDPETDAVSVKVVAHSKPSSLLVKLSGPIGRAMQWRSARHYLDGFANPESAPAGPAASEVSRVGKESDASIRSEPPFNLFSARWWFENRLTGERTIAQPPNWPLFAIIGLTLGRFLVDPEEGVRNLVGYAISALLVYWGSDEIIRGVNPWRKVLGSVMVVIQVVRFVL